MTKDDVITRIKRGLGFRTDLDDAIVDALVEAQMLLEGATTLPWFIEKAATLYTSNDGLISGTVAASVPLPSDFIRIVEDEGFRYLETSEQNGLWLHRRPYDESRTYYLEDDAQAPIAYTLRGASIVFFPAPDEVYPLDWTYYAKQEALTGTAATNQWLINVPYLLIGMAGRTVAKDLEYTESAAKFEIQMLTWRDWLQREMAMREQAHMPRKMGVNR